jgi:general secretion pathway protein C
MLFGAPSVPSRVLQGSEPGRADAQADLARLLGADAPAAQEAEVQVPLANARFQLIGVVSPRSALAAREGLALVSVDGRPPRAFRVGNLVEGQNVLQTVEARSARLGPRDGAATVLLSLAPPAAAATGVLPAAGSGPYSGGAAATPGARPNGTTAAPRAAFQSEQERFHQRQQLQFQEEQMQNQGPYSADTAPAPKGEPQGSPGVLR